jgi:methionyl-tRNA synthetase
MSYDVFQRTTDPAHYKASQAIWQAMAANGDLYLDRYEGWYSVRDEAFTTRSELVAGEGARSSARRARRWNGQVEESWFFRLSAYGDRCWRFTANIPSSSARKPPQRGDPLCGRGPARSFGQRTSFDWGVPVPGSPM